MRTKLNKLAHCATVGSEPTLLYTQDAVEFLNYNPVNLDCYTYNETPAASLSQYSVYPTFSYDEELGFRIKTEQDLVFMEQPQIHNIKEEAIDPWMLPSQFIKPQPEAPPPLHDIPEHFTDWSKFTPPISPSQSNENELRIPFLPSKVRKRRSSSNSGRLRNSRSSMVPLSSPGPGAGSPGSQSSEGFSVDQLLVELRETRQLPWKNCAEVFKERGKDIKVPALQMRYKRLKDKALIWEAEDVERLQEAKLNVEARIEENRMIWIAEEMLKLGGEDPRPYSPSSCEKKLKELGTLAAVAAAASPDS